MESIKVKDKLGLINDLRKPEVIAEFNGQQIKISKVKGEFSWHYHKDEDELFYILKGKMVMEFTDKKVEVNEGEMMMVPKGVEHRTVSNEEVWMMFFEPQNIMHTSDVKSALNVENYEKI